MINNENCFKIYLKCFENKCDVLFYIYDLLFVIVIIFRILICL